MIPARTSPDPITASSLDVCLFIMILVGEPITVVLPFNKILDLHIFKNLKTFSLLVKFFFIFGKSL